MSKEILAYTFAFVSLTFFCDQVFADSLCRSFFKSNKQLVKAVKKGDITKAKKLLDEGADVNAVSKDHQTLLVLAVKKGDKEMAQFLAEKWRGCEWKREKRLVAFNMGFPQGL